MPTDWRPKEQEAPLFGRVCARCRRDISPGSVYTFFKDHSYCPNCVCRNCFEPFVLGTGVSVLDGNRYCRDCTPSQGLETKHDANKPRYDLIPPDALDSIAQVLAYGADKYSPRGWEKGTSWGRYFAACMRHLWAWWRGERLDPESALPHLAHAACCVMFLLAYEIREVGEDDRT